MSKVYFSETQNFDLLWMKIVMITASAGAVIPLLVASYQQMVLDQPWGQHAPSDFSLLYITLAMLLIVIGVNVMIFSSKLETKITADSIQYRYRPFVFNWRTVLVKELESAQLRRYNAWREYGGRGFKFRFIGKKGRALTIRGDQGLQLLFKNGKKLLLGTQRPQEVNIALQKFLKPRIE